MSGIELDLFLKVRKYSRWAVGVAIIASFIFAQLIESRNNTWQVAIALLALAVGIPHGALDHLVTLPKSSALKMSLFIFIYVAVFRFIYIYICGSFSFYLVYIYICGSFSYIHVHSNFHG